MDQLLIQECNTEKAACVELGPPKFYTSSIMPWRSKKRCWKERVQRPSLFSVWKIKVLWAETSPVWAHSHQPEKPLMHQQMVEKQEEKKHLLGNRHYSVTISAILGPDLSLWQTTEPEGPKQHRHPQLDHPQPLQKQSTQNPLVTFKIQRQQIRVERVVLSVRHRGEVQSETSSLLTHWCNWWETVFLGLRAN